MDAEIAMNQQLHLVPCRWERSGWRYVQAAPGQIGFFNNPNRVNNFGVMADNKQRRYDSAVRGGSSNFYMTSNKSAFGQVKNIGETTYGQNFIPQR